MVIHRPESVTYVAYSALYRASEQALCCKLSHRHRALLTSFDMVKETMSSSQPARSPAGTR